MPGGKTPCCKELPQGLPPAKIYADDQGSYASNEIAINWQAALVFLLAGIAAIDGKAARPRRAGKMAARISEQLQSRLIVDRTIRKRTTI